MKTFTAVLVGAVLGGVVTAGIMCHLLERQKALARRQKFLRSLLADPSISVRQELVGSVSKFFRKDLTTAGAEMVLNLLQSPEPRDPGWVGSLAEAAFSPALEERLIRLAQEYGGSDSMARAILNSLGTQTNKSDACVEFLLANLADPDRRFSGRDMRAFWFGPIPKRFDRRIADAAVRVFEGHSGDEAKFSAVTLFQRFGEADHPEAMGRWAQRPDLNPEVRQQLESTMKQVADRLRREAATSQ